MATKRGIGDIGRQRIRKNWEDIESGSTTPSWLVGGPPSEQNQALREQIEAENQAFAEQIGAQSVEQLVDLWPDKSNYYKGPKKSTRVWKHRFVMEPSNTQTAFPTGLGTVFVQFTNLRQHKDGSIYEGKYHGAVEAYYHVPYSVYQSFTETQSKGQFINHTLNGYNHVNLGTDDSVFSTNYQG